MRLHFGMRYASPFPDLTYPVASFARHHPGPGGPFRDKPSRTNRAVIHGGWRRGHQLCGAAGLQGDTKMNTSIRKFLAEEDGITALEYGVLAALVAGALVAAFYPALKDLYTNLFGTMTTSVEAAASKSG